MSLPFAACTIVARNYLSYAAIVAESYLRHAPGARFYVLVVDGMPAGAALPEGVRVLGPEDLGLASFHRMSFKYDVTELCTAVKPALLSLVLDRFQEEAVVYLDPDILVLQPLDALQAALDEAEIVLLPHLLDPIPQDGQRPSERDILIAGAYNLGFLALRKGGEARRLLAWWSERLEDGCRVAPAEGLFVDQRWMDLVPGLFPRTALLRDPAYDVAYWNLHSRRLTKRDGTYLAGGRPLVFFHFSGFDPARPRELSRHQSRIDVAAHPVLAELLRCYADLHARHGHAAHAEAGYGYSRFSNDVEVSPVFRRLYLGLSDHERRRFGDPYHANGRASFFGWAVAQPEESSSLSPFLDALYRTRADLRLAFPDVQGRGRGAFVEWARGQGAGEMDFPSSLVPPARPAAAPARPERLSLPGVNVAGYLRNETGLGAVARGYVAALRLAGVPVSLKDVSELSPNRSLDPTLGQGDAHHPHPINLLCVNADAQPGVAAHLGRSFFHGRRSIGVWHWELPEFPPEWHDRFAHHDEIWATSSFVAGSLAAVSPVPVVRMPPALTPDPGDRARGRARLGIEEGTFLWLFVFDLRSYAARKNPLGLVEAFARAFAPGERVRLVLKCVNAEADAEAFAALQEAAGGRAVTIVEGYWSAGEMNDLLAACDGYASLHRSEGLGVPLAHAMGLGKPVVATGWSGNMDFMDVGNSFPVRHRLVKLAADVGPYRAGSTWAEPCLDHAALLLRQVVAGGPEVEAVAAAARRTIEQGYSVERAAARVAARLRLLDAPAPTPGWSHGPPALPRLDLSSSQHGWLGRCVKRVVAFLVRYHTFHQQQVNATLAASLGDLGSRVETLSARVAELARGGDRK